MDIAARNCTVRDGSFVVPCAALQTVTDNIAPGFSKKKGIARWSLVNMGTHEPSRSYFGVKCAEYPNGFLFNFCPFCGVKIDAPFNSDVKDGDCTCGEVCGEDPSCVLHGRGTGWDEFT